MRVTIGQQDIDLLRNQFPELEFGDDERTAVLLRMDSIDVQAAPGSGKTTLLAAKLSLIASKWHNDRSGVCIISHTNAARDEIEKRLRVTQDGRNILSYPHFVGTIQSFVHTFLALPYLRSCGTPPEVVDNDHFEEQALRLAKRDRILIGWMKYAPYQAQEVIRSLRYQGSALTVDCASGAIPKPTSMSYPRLVALKRTLTERGIFRYDDMFAYAERVLAQHPGMISSLSCRFPLLFIDEMQDTSKAQEDLLGRLFDETVVVQRLGDLNQRILSDTTQGGPPTFPRAGYLNVSSSKRFSQQIANVVSRLKEVGHDIVGVGPEPVAPPTLFLYRDDTILNVIPAFASFLTEHFSQDELNSGSTYAVCARKQGDSKQGIGRHILDYWPLYDETRTIITGTHSTLLDIMRAGNKELENDRIPKRTASFRTALLTLLKSTGGEEVQGIRAWRDLVSRIDTNGSAVSTLNNLVRDAVLEPPDTNSADAWAAFGKRIYEALRPFLRKELTEEDFGKTDFLAFDNAPIPAAGRAAPDAVSVNVYQATHDNIKVAVRISTIAGIKGETHLATLVLESFLRNGFDITEALPYLLGMSDSAAVTNQRLKTQLRSLFVGATRPSRLLCLAMHSGRLTQGHREALLRAGWGLRDC